ncbi:PH domain-containing protein [Demequina mangrovi]|uniref:PH domain-containing protein n=1 Tax=Demequina mangrovi TaxID=1043493 RepID=A0A1H6UW07_9MICO|nr:PH domain-containing protein [Demequina mangrovi]SEI96593.1 PH domain-containing protein [Demequina mangrovi]
MPYPRHLLAPDEEIVVDSHPHWKALVGPVAASLAGIALIALAWWWVASVEYADAVETGIGIVAGVAAAVLIGWLAVAPFIRWSTTHFVITDRRVIFRTGVLTKSGIDIPLARVNTVQFRHGLIDRMFRTGTLIIESASDDPLSFDDIPNVEKVHALLYDEVFETLEGDEDPRPAPA